MQLRAYFWKDRIFPLVLSILKGIKYPKSSFFFRKGNFGDIFYEDLAKYFYGSDLRIKVSKSQGNRLLLIGSIGHKILPGDLACGIGSKFEEVPSPAGPCHLVGLRGPLSLEVFRNAGYDTSNIQFLYDPGLLVRYLYPETDSPSHKPQGALFIPHYRERFSYTKLPDGFQLCDPDNNPDEVARQVRASEVVYSSSLHGIIFAHAYGRPAIFVTPKTKEPEFKYKDYFASIGSTMPNPIENIESCNVRNDLGKSPNFEYKLSDFRFPTADELKSRGIAF